MTAAALSSCTAGVSAPEPIETRSSEYSDTAEGTSLESGSETVSSPEAAATPPPEQTDAESAETTSVPAAETAVTTEDTSDTETSTGETVTEPESETSPAETASSEIITDTEYSELLISDTELLAETAAQRETAEEASASQPPAEIVIPQIYTGNFNGSATLQNELACVDISDTENGVILVKYSGSCAKVKVRVTKDSSVYDYDLDPSGTVFPLQSGSGNYNIKIMENVSGATYAIALDMDFSADIKSELSPFLMPAQFISYKTSDKCVYKAAELCAGKTGDTDKIAAMFSYVTDNISYDKQLAASVKSGYIPSPDATLEKGTGICFDYASLFAAMCRSQSIPAKLVMGYVKGNIYHAWNEVYTQETGWVTVDLFLGSKGWNLLDPTFYATAGNDKQEVAEYIGSGSDYSAVYYY
ncbi:MAG: transglutaminase domain-containing protein [Ruminococcus sp.]|nr:transglutaminase domain-containing protein [Ruminococcus sp.]